MHQRGRGRSSFGVYFAGFLILVLIVVGFISQAAEPASRVLAPMVTSAMFGADPVPTPEPQFVIICPLGSKSLVVLSLPPFPADPKKCEERP